MKNKIILAVVLAFAAAYAAGQADTIQTGALNNTDLNLTNNIMIVPDYPTWTPIGDCTRADADPRCTLVGKDLLQFQLQASEDINPQPFENNAYKNCRCNLTAPGSGISLDYCCQYVDTQYRAKVFSGAAGTAWNPSYCQTPCARVTCTNSEWNGQMYKETTGKCCRPACSGTWNAAQNCCNLSVDYQCSFKQYFQTDQGWFYSDGTPIPLCSKLGAGSPLPCSPPNADMVALMQNSIMIKTISTGTCATADDLRGCSPAR